MNTRATRRQLRTPELLAGLTREARGGDVVSTSGGAALVAVPAEHVLAVVEWVRELQQRLNAEREVARLNVRDRARARAKNGRPRRPRRR
ncbi:MAG: hypothetical protein ACPGQD_07190 [Planctomycetota bacterium]